MVIPAAPTVDAAWGRDPSDTPWLKSLRVVKLGSSVPLDMAGQILAQFGAEVVEANAGDSYADWGQPDCVLADRVERPVVLASLVDSSAASYLDHVEAINQSVWVTASAYGLSSSRADAFASELTVLAAGGILGHSRIGDEWAPTFPAGSLGLSLVGNVMAMATLHGVHQYLTEGRPRHVDLSAQGCVVANGLALEMAHALANCPDEGGSARYGAPTGFFECTDGSIFVCTLEEHQWSAFRRTLAPTLDEIVTLEDARNRSDEVNALMAGWASTHTISYCEFILQSAGVPCTAVNTVDRLLDRLADIHRPLDVTTVHAPKIPALVRSSPGKHPAAGRQGVIPLNELRVLDAGHVLAVPLAMSWLGAMGAKVTKHEDMDRLDIYRRRGPFADGLPGINRSAYFNQLNFCKTQWVSTVDGSSGSLDLSAFDVVTNNQSPGRAQILGVDLASAIADEAPRLAVSSSGFGRVGAWSHYRAYGHNIHAFGGLVAATLDAEGNLGDVGTPWTDPLTSIAVATWVLAWSLATDRTSSVAADISMAEIMAAQLTPLLGTDPRDFYKAPTDEADFFARAPKSDRLVAVTLADVEQIARFEETIGQKLPPMRMRGELVDLSWGPLSHNDDDHLIEALLGIGFAVAMVYTAPELKRDPFLRSTGLIRSLSSSELGSYEVTGMPWRFVGDEGISIWAEAELSLPQMA